MGREETWQNIFNNYSCLHFVSAFRIYTAYIYEMTNIFNRVLPYLVRYWCDWFTNVSKKILINVLRMSRKIEICARVKRSKLWTCSNTIHSQRCSFKKSMQFGHSVLWLAFVCTCTWWVCACGCVNLFYGVFICTCWCVQLFYWVCMCGWVQCCCAHSSIGSKIFISFYCMSSSPDSLVFSWFFRVAFFWLDSSRTKVPMLHKTSIFRLHNLNLFWIEIQHLFITR